MIPLVDQLSRGRLNVQFLAAKKQTGHGWDTVWKKRKERKREKIRMMNNIPNREGTDRININKNKEGTELKNLMQGPPLAFSDEQDKKEEGKEGRRKKNTLVIPTLPE